MRNPSSRKNSKRRIPDFLDLTGCTFKTRTFVEHILVIRASIDGVPFGCPKCKRKRMSVLRTEDRIFWDVPHLGQPTLVQLAIPKIICDTCGYQIETTLPWLHPTRKMTHRLIEFILARATTLTTFAQIASDTGQDPSTITDIFMEAFTRWDDRKGMDLPETLGIDEVWLHGGYLTILVNSETGAAVDLLKGKSKDTITKRLRAAPNAGDVTRVTQDFSDSFRDAATKPYDPKEKNDSAKSDAEQPKGTFETPLFGMLPNVDAREPAADGFIQIPEGDLSAALPNAVVVGDHFHLKQAFEKDFDDIRLHVQKSMAGHYVSLQMSRFTEAQAASPVFEAAIVCARKKAVELAEAAAYELKKKRYILFKRDDHKLLDEERLWVDRILLEYPLLKKGWDVKNAGLAIFPVKPRAKKNKTAAKEVLAAIGPTNDAAVGQRLDDWVLSIDEELQPFYSRAIGLIKNWRAEIIRIDTTDLSNSRAECKNRFLRLLEAIGRGLNFETIRARLLWADAHRRTNRWPRLCDKVERMSARKLIKILDDIEL